MPRATSHFLGPNDGDEIVMSLSQKLDYFGDDDDDDDDFFKDEEDVGTDEFEGLKAINGNE